MIYEQSSHWQHLTLGVLDLRYLLRLTQKHNQDSVRCVAPSRVVTLFTHTHTRHNGSYTGYLLQHLTGL